MPRTSALLAGFVLAAASSSASSPEPPERRTVIGELSVAGCAEHQPPADCLRPGNPVLLESADGELYLLHGVERIDLERLQGMAGRPVAVTGPFSWLGRMRTLRLDVVRAASDQEVGAARSAELESVPLQSFMVVLRPGPARQQVDGARRAELLKGHLERLRQQAAAGSLRLAGRFGELEPEQGLAGLCLYAAGSRAEAEALVAQDPAVEAGWFTAETLPWVNTAGLAP